jgi:WD40 repeat protein
LKLVSRNGETIADLVSGSPEPHFVGDPQVSYTDAIWSPDGSRIAVSYKQADGNRCPFIGNSSAAGLRKLDNCEADDHPRFWSIDGKWLITWSEREPKLYAYEVNGSRRVAFEQLGKLQIYDQRYFPWKVIDQPVCKGDTGFWSCQ